LATNWRSVAGLSDHEVAGVIAADRIDILVDLGGHTANSRLLVLSHRPAPVQMTYLGYPNTSGLATVDYRITDACADPAGLPDRVHSERLLRLDGCFVCFEAPTDAPTPSTLPALERGYLTFGSFNNISKITPRVVQLWASVLHRCPGSRLIMKARGLEDEQTADRFRQLFASHRVAADRITFIGYIAGNDAHLSSYQDIDIALDPFPYNGTTTTCEALWMGVPVITLAGQVHAGRVGVSLLTALGLQRWIANSTDDYQSLALNWSRQLPKLASLRGQLRERMRLSVLMDNSRFVGELEYRFRQVWREGGQLANSQAPPPTDDRL